MSAPIRFLTLAVIGWGAVRAVTLGAVPGFTVSYAHDLSARQALPPPQATEFPPLPPVEPLAEQPWTAQLADYWPAAPVRRIAAAPYYAPAYFDAPSEAPIAPRPAWRLSSSSSYAAPEFYAPIPTIDALAGTTFPPRRVSRPVSLTAAGSKPRLDRWQMSSWALLRGAPSPGSLATGGTLGGSQAGARLTYAFNRWLAASLRTTSPVGGSRGAEVAGGVRLTPLRSVPIALTLERRQSISPHGGGRSDFALFAEGGLYRQPMPLRFTLDAYVQAGVVGVQRRDLFIDGAFAFTRPVWGRVSAGFGLWGGAQAGVYRLDAGPRVSVRVRDNVHAHADWRQRLAGSARPASGPALTLAADF